MWGWPYFHTLLNDDSQFQRMNTTDFRRTQLLMLIMKTSSNTHLSTDNLHFILLCTCLQSKIFLAATGALEVKMLVRMSVPHTFNSCTTADYSWLQLTTADYSWLWLQLTTTTWTTYEESCVDCRYLLPTEDLLS